MTVPAREPLGASTLARKWYLDIDTGAAGTPEWTGVFGLTEFQPSQEKTLQDDGDFDSGGFGSQTSTQIAWSLTGKLARKTTASDPTTYDPGQEEIRLAGDDVGQAARRHFRWYEMTPGGPRVEAYEGWGDVQWTPDGGDKAALDTVSFTVTGQGKRLSITHPDAGV